MDREFCAWQEMIPLCESDAPYGTKSYYVIRGIFRNFKWGGGGGGGGTYMGQSLLQKG